MRITCLARATFLFLIILFLGCAHWPTATRSISIDKEAAKKDIIELAIDVAKSMGFPPVTKLDKPSGIVEFGKFGSSVTGITAQVRIRPDNQVDITVIRGSVYIPLPVEETADKFRNLLVERLQQAR